MNKNIILLIMAGIIVIGISTIGYYKSENLEDNKKTLGDIKKMLDNNEIITPMDMQYVAKNEFGKGETSKYLYKDENSQTDIDYTLTEYQDIAFHDKEKRLKTLSKDDQKLEKKRAEFMNLFNQSYRKYVDKTIKSGLKKDNFEDVGEIYSEWLDILYSNGNIDPISFEGIMVYTYSVDTVAFDGYTMKMIRDLLIANTYEEEKYSVEKSIKIMADQREIYNTHIYEHYNYIRSFNVK